MKRQQKIWAEFLGSAFLLLAVVGSGIMGESLAQGNAAVALLANSLATGAALFVLIQALGSISGAHFNPVVSVAEALWKRLSPKDLPLYVAAQFLGALVGVLAAHLLFHQPLLQVSAHARSGVSQGISEGVATFGLLATIALAGKKHPEFAPMAVAAYITGAYWFTSSTSFANPAVTVARMFTDTFTGIAPSSAPLFVLGQLGGMAVAVWAFRKRPL
ncbi:MAG TPA: MIP/aquaporin family protein [Bdellovibrionota bacterium]|nr:MIP/aquaporin family protein [Bdellovibrionota bacterium]